MSAEQHQKRLGEMLVDKGLITSAQLEDALKEQIISGHFLGEILVSRGAISGKEIAQVLSEQLGFAYVELSTMAIEAKAVELIPEDLCLKHKAVPLFILHDNLTIAMANPLNVNAVDEFQAASNLRIRPVFASSEEIKDAIKKYYHAQPEEQRQQQLAATDYKQMPTGGPSYQQPYGPMSPRTEGASVEKIDSLRQAASLAPVVQTVNDIINKAVEMNASDIHLEPQRDGLKNRYRIDGILYPISIMPQNMQSAVVSRIKIMANLDIAEKRLPQDGRIRMFAVNREIDLRVSTFPTIYGENLVLRILDRSGGMLELDEIGFTKKTLDDFRKLIHRPYGIILVTGPTGSGKTTTLYGALNEVSTEEKNVITLEDPVEYEVAGVRQAQVNVKAGLTFASGLRSIVRQDPDIIMIGEIRDRETAEIAIHAALTGHLVFSTLHTNDAPSAASRLVDMGIEPFLISSSLIGIMAQRLVRILCSSCKEEYLPPEELLKQIDVNNIPAMEKLKFYKEIGCRKCKQWGYSGRKGIYELLLPNDEIRELIIEKASATVIRETARKAGMQTLREAGIEKVLTGETSVSEIIRVTENV